MIDRANVRFQAQRVSWPVPPLVEQVVLVADGDGVGVAAAYRAAQRYGASGRRMRLVELPRG
jgi:DNA primase